MWIAGSYRPVSLVYLAVQDPHDPIRRREHFVVVGGTYDRRPQFELQPLEHSKNLLSRLQVQVASGLLLQK